VARIVRIASAGLLAVLASLLAFVVLTVVWTVAAANSDVRGYVTATAITAGVTGGVVAGVVFARKRTGNVLDAMSVGAAVAIGVLLLFLPFVVAAFSM
jgi:hypothetical protein